MLDIPRYHVEMTPDDGRDVGIRQDRAGSWVLWRDARPYVEYAISHGMEPLDHHIPDGVAHGAEDKEEPVLPKWLGNKLILRSVDEEEEADRLAFEDSEWHEWISQDVDEDK